MELGRTHKSSRLLRLARCPLCADSDQIPQRSEMTRCAMNGHYQMPRRAQPCLRNWISSLRYLAPRKADCGGTPYLSESVPVRSRLEFGSANFQFQLNPAGCRRMLRAPSNGTDLR